MIDQDLEVVKVALTVVTPWPVEHLIEVGVVALLLRHDRNKQLSDLTEGRTDGRDLQRSEILRPRQTAIALLWWQVQCEESDDEGS
jgi:hypothetical protein